LSFFIIFFLKILFQIFFLCWCIVTEIERPNSASKNLLKKSTLEILDYDSRLPALGRTKSIMKNKNKELTSDDSDEFLPSLVKNSILQKNENSVTFNVNSIINRNNDYFPLETLVVSYF